MVTLYTYSPLIGMTSQTDPNGLTTYYEYDSFNRLKLLRDKNQNIIKTYDYHYHSGSSADATLLSLSTTSINLAATTSLSSFSITANCLWSITSNATWLTVSPSSGNGNCSITVNATANSDAARSATVTVTYGNGLTQTVVVTQAVGTQTSTLSPDNTLLDFGLLPETQYLAIYSNTTWTVTTKPSWVTVSPSSGSGDSTIEIGVAKLISGARSGFVKLRTSDGTATIEIYVSQSNIGI